MTGQKPSGLAFYIALRGRTLRREEDEVGVLIGVSSVPCDCGDGSRLDLNRLSSSAESAVVEWLGAEEITGSELRGWTDEIWVLHAMYERPGRASETHHERRLDRIKRGLIRPRIINGHNVDDDVIDSGARLGFTHRPSPEWKRMSWSDLAARLGFELGAGQIVPPCFRWFPTRSWPVNIRPPGEGSLDEESLNELTRVFANHTEDTGEDCFVSYASLITGDYSGPEVYSLPLVTLPDLPRNGPHHFAPSNIWANDRSWFVWTDYDLWATRVSGPRSLIRELEDSPTLETIRWSPSE